MVVLLAGPGGGASSFISAGGFIPHGCAPVVTADALGGIIDAYSGPRSSTGRAAEGASPKRGVPSALLVAVGGALRAPRAAAGRGLARRVTRVRLCHGACRHPCGICGG